jgi:hypothetical protein
MYISSRTHTHTQHEIELKQLKTQAYYQLKTAKEHYNEEIRLLREDMETILEVRECVRVRARARARVCVCVYRRRTCIYLFIHYFTPPYYIVQRKKNEGDNQNAKIHQLSLLHEKTTRDFKEALEQHSFDIREEYELKLHKQYGLNDSHKQDTEKLKLKLAGHIDDHDTELTRLQRKYEALASEAKTEHTKGERV